MKTVQFLLTRFNVPVSFATSPDCGLDEEWLTHRFDLFEAFCLPSVTAQDHESFFWILAVDNRTPDPWILRLKKGLARLQSRAVLKPVREEPGLDMTSEVLRIATALGADRILTTRLDNDDALAGTYLSSVREACRTLPATGNFVIDFTHGCQVDKTGIFSASIRLNPFLSVLSSAADLRTAFYTKHHRMGRAGTVIQPEGTSRDRAMWMQVFHSRNAKNRHATRATELDESAIRHFSLGEHWRTVLQR